MKRPCLAPYHPFKQSWFETDDPTANYCTSCHHFTDMMLNLLSVFVFRPFETLYGNRYIQLSREDAHALLDQAYDKHEKEKP